MFPDLGSKIVDSRGECRNQRLILSTGAVVEISTAAPVVEIWRQFRQASRESTIFAARGPKDAKPREECDDSGPGASALGL